MTNVKLNLVLVFKLSTLCQKDFREVTKQVNDNFAIAVRPGDPLQAKFNESLANLKANGTYDKINQKYFTVSAASTSAATVENTEQPAADSTAQ